LTAFATAPSTSPHRSDKPGIAKLTFWPLVAATFFMVSGGTYGTEEIVQGAGYTRALLILLVTPIVWSLPVALMIGELASALPDEGGYYAWVRRGMGNLWGFQEAWLSLVASIFDMAIYPTLFVAYLARLAPAVRVGHRAFFVELAVVAVCVALNLAGIHLVGLTSVWLFALLSAPFALMVVLAPFQVGALAHARTAAPVASVGLLGGILICMWNYMGWDNASTIARGVEHPQHTYPGAMLVAVLVIALSYMLPVFAAALTGLPPATFDTGAWADLAGLMAGKWLRFAVVLGGMMCGFGMFNALVMSYSRLPLAMAQDGMLPRAFAKLHPKTGAPWVAIVACAIGWALCLQLGFEQLVTIDITLYGSSLVLEFVALVSLRIREPGLPRPVRLPGGMPGAVIAGLLPTALLAFAALNSERERVLGIDGLAFGALVILSGFAAYWATGKFRRASHRLQT